MKADVAISAENVYKKYCRSIKKSMIYGMADISRNLIGRSSNPDVLRPEEFWALEGINFEVNKGETLGIIGPNGSGKSTLLKMLNGIFWPDIGRIQIRGRVGALIEVGAGFHPLLTGRENIYLSASILGITKEEVEEQFEEIIRFADIGEFIDAPVKYYSSGMYVRLGFSVAIHMKPEILLIDEVLAVGDLDFRSRCMNKIDEIKQTGVTTVFVSHNMRQIDRLCDQVIFIKKGHLASSGKTSTVVNDYFSDVYSKSLKETTSIQNLDSETVGLETTKTVTVTKVEPVDSNNNNKTTFNFQDDVTIRIEFEAHKKIVKPIFEVGIISADFVTICSTTTGNETKRPTIDGPGVVECTFPKINLLPGTYYLKCSIMGQSGEKYFVTQRLPGFQIKAKDYSIMREADGLIYATTKWRLNKS